MRKLVALIATLMLVGMIAGCTNKNETPIPATKTEEKEYIYETVDFAGTESTQETDAVETEFVEASEYDEEIGTEETVITAEETEPTEESAQETSPVSTETSNEVGEEDWGGGKVEIEF